VDEAAVTIELLSEVIVKLRREKNEILLQLHELKAELAKDTDSGNN
tara:strand:- start:269 stop:406 length:138 start_codon:yes stop_codon:yes gene_type:complete